MRRHYGFRIEVDGVLISGTKTKAPLRDTPVKRLVVDGEIIRWIRGVCGMIPG